MVKQVLNKIEENKIIILATVAVALSVGFLVGITTNTAQGKCYERADTCHGIPVGNTCVGLETTERNFYNEEECEEVSEIEENCQDVGNDIVEEQPELEDQWKEQVDYRGISCKTWEENFEIELE